MIFRKKLFNLEKIVIFTKKVIKTLYFLSIASIPLFTKEISIKIDENRKTPYF